MTYDRDDRIVKTVSRTSKILLCCEDHPHLRWYTKNIGYVGARNFFFAGDASRPGYRVFPWGALPDQITQDDGSVITRDEMEFELLLDGWVTECSCPSNKLRIVPNQSD
jgi:hypothetical protein